MLKDLKVKPYMVLGYLCLGELYADAGHREDALKNLKKAKNIYQEMEIGFWSARVQEVLGRL